MAHKYQRAQITGVDFWGQNWEYSKSVCEKNASLEGVSEHVSFQNGSASALPFEDGCFDVVISNLTFHEVRSVKDKKEAVREALRVLKPGGSFVFQDLFLWKVVYGEIDVLLGTIRNWEVSEVEFIDTSKSPYIPRMLKLPFMVGTMALIRGRRESV